MRIRNSIRRENKHRNSKMNEIFFSLPDLEISIVMTFYMFLIIGKTNLKNLISNIKENKKIKIPFEDVINLSGEKKKHLKKH